jgi:DNA-binding MarR family transcriptional regulator
MQLCGGEVEINKIRAFRKILRRFEHQIDHQAALCCFEVTLAQCHTLLELEAAEKTTIGKLAKRLELDKSTLSRTVEGLVKRGLVERKVDPEDRRYSNVSLTKGGQEICDEINRMNDAYYNAVFGEIPAAKHDVILQALTLLTEAMSNQ